jgi:predicted translin family RNA/ssDNA-binding protein
LGVETEAYLLGLCDLTGELVRKAVKDVIDGKYDSAEEITKLVEEIYGEFLKFDLRNGNLRQKSDSIKWNLQKLEQLLLDINKA